MNKELYELFATAPKGMGNLLKDELLKIGAENLSEHGAGIAFRGTQECAYKACLWSRIASRVLLVLQKSRVRDAQELYDAVQKICWSDHLSVDNTLAVNFSASQDQLHNNRQLKNTHFAALKVKDAIVDQFRIIDGSRPSVDPINPDIRINVHLHNDEASISLDLSGESLHRRGYREHGHEAPLKENLAAAILMLSGFGQRQGLDLIDPMCGSGTLPLEAALIAANIAPGLLRTSFGFINWQGHVPKLWERLLQEANDLIISDTKLLPNINGYDQDERAIQVALSNLARVRQKLSLNFIKQDLSKCRPTSAKGILVVNPPYGERMGDTIKLQSLYKELGNILKHKFGGWEAYLFTSNPDLVKCVGLKATQRFVLFNGSLECRLLKYELY